MGEEQLGADSPLTDEQALASVADGTPLESTDLGRQDPMYDEAVRDIYKQTHAHRDNLVDFYKNYTTGFTVVVFILVFAQAVVRMALPESNFEIMPQWTLNLLVIGMFGQFLVLLKIVTKSVWDLPALFRHHNEMRNGAKDSDDNI